MTGPIRWTDARPDRPDWWWHRPRPGGDRFAVRVWRDGTLGRLWCCYPDVEHPTSFAMSHRGVDDVPGQWSDRPIPGPEESEETAP